MHEKLEAANLTIQSHDISSGSPPNSSKPQDYIDTPSNAQTDPMVDSYMQ